MSNYIIKPDLNILIVEDDRSLRKYLTAYFKKRGVKKVYEASSGSAALEICTQKPINFIISDWNMPGMSGIELLEAIRSVSSSYGDVPFIIITASREKNQVARAGKEAVDDYIIKPFKTKFLEERFESLLLKKSFDEYVALCYQDILNCNYDRAKEKLTLAFEQRKSDTNVLCGLAICNAELGCVSTAEQYLCMIIDDDNALALYAKGCLEAAKGFRGKALNTLKICTKNFHDFIYAHIKIFDIYIKMGKFQKAQEVREIIDNLKITYTYDYKILGDKTV